MSARAVLRDLRTRGFSVSADGSDLVLDGPIDTLTDGIVDRLRAMKPELLAALALDAVLASPALAAFREIHLVDFEFVAPDGERPVVVCLAAKELRSGRATRLWRDELGPEPPYSVGPDALFVSYAAAAEMSCHLVLGWPLPTNVLDLHVEAVRLFNGKRPPRAPIQDGKKRGAKGVQLQDMLHHYGLPLVENKQETRDLIARGGPWVQAEREAILAYCEQDVVALERLLPRMLPEIGSIFQTLERGRYSGPAVARKEHIGVPIDVEGHARLKVGWKGIRRGAIRELDTAGVYEGTSFNEAKHAAWIEANGFDWPRLDSGKYGKSKENFEDMARRYPEVAPIALLVALFSDLRSFGLDLGSDGRNRAATMAFGAITGRNTPSNSKFIFGPSRWLRGLIRPEPGMALAYIDWSQQEYGIAAKLSGDKVMMDAYNSGDFYMTFAIQAGAAPVGSTKKTHPRIRSIYKTCALGLCYGMGARTLSRRTGLPLAEAEEQVRRARQTYRTFWEWSEENVLRARRDGFIETCRGWRFHVTEDTPYGTLKNWKMPAHGAEMMRLAACLATEAGIRVCASVHDAFLIEASAEEIDHDVERMCECMAEASRIILDGFVIRTEKPKPVLYPDRYMDEGGAEMWTRVMRLLEDVEANPEPPEPPKPAKRKRTSEPRPPDLFEDLPGAAS